MGEISNSLPHGKGNLYLHKDSPAFKTLSNKVSINPENYSVIEVLYENGKIHKCKINLKNGLTYEGNLDLK